MKVREYNEQIEILNLKKIIEYVKDDVTHYIMPSEYSTEESMAIELVDAGFVDTIDAPITENQYLGEVYKKDGKFYRDAIDVVLPTPEDLFSFEKFTSDLRLELGARIIAIDQYAYSIMKNVELKDFDLAKQLILGHIQAGHLIQSDYDIFKSVLAKQDINLDLC